MNTTLQSELQRLLGDVFDGATGGLRREVGPEEYSRRRRDFIFHMTDWQLDLGELTNLFQNPGQFDEGTASPLIIGFLYHVIPHLNAAGRLLLDEIRDPFASLESRRESGSNPAASSAN